MARTFEARYPGRCSQCKTPFKEGEDIGLVDGIPVCGACAEADDFTTAPRPTEICPQCFQAKAANGLCGCF
jgi:hypothetical protein